MAREKTGHGHGCIILLLCIFLAGCSSEEKKAPTYPVTLGETTQKDVPIFIEVIGNVYSLQVVQVRPQVGGILLEAYVKQGQYVKKGDPLYKIDPRPYEADLEKAKAALIKDQAALKLAEITVERNKELVKNDYVAKLTFDTYEANVKSAEGQVKSDEADIALAQLNVEWTVPKSPIDGKISQYNIYPGNLVITNDPNALTDIRQITPADIWFYITQKEFYKVQKSMHEGLFKFEVILPENPDQARQGNIYFIDNHVDLNTGSILLKGTVPNADEMFWPGEFVRVRLQLKVQKNAVLVPDEAVKIGQNGAFVYVYKSDTSTVEYRLIEKGVRVGNLRVVNKGLTLGEKVVVRGQVNLRPNAKVYIAENLEASKAGIK